MRAYLLVSAMVIGSVASAIAMPVAPGDFLPSTVLQVHGCHHNYSHDMTGWHRHDQGCRTLRGVVGRKARNPAKS